MSKSWSIIGAVAAAAIDARVLRRTDLTDLTDLVELVVAAAARECCCAATVVPVLPSPAFGDARLLCRMPFPLAVVGLSGSAPVVDRPNFADFAVVIDRDRFSGI